MGTPQYMSPEQAVGRLDLLGPASDVYSLGAILYVLLSDRAPFHGRSFARARIVKGKGGSNSCPKCHGKGVIHAMVLPRA